MTHATFQKEARLRAVLAGERPDRSPVALWRHWPEDDQRGESLARATVAFQRLYDFDFVKLCPASNYAVDGWGGCSVRGDSTVGTRDWTRRAVRQPEDWCRLRPLKPDSGLQGELLTAIRLVRAELGAGVPIIPTVFNPLAMAKYLAGEETLFEHLHLAPDAVAAGLRTLAESTVRFVEVAKRQGIDGVFFAVQHASRARWSEDAYRQFGEPGDRAVLAAVDDCWLNVLHLHGREPMVSLVEDYPVAAINWHTTESGLRLGDVAATTRKAVCGGLSSGFPLTGGTPTDVQEAVERAKDEAGMNRLIVSAACVLPLAVSHANIAAARAAVETRS